MIAGTEASYVIAGTEASYVIAGTEASYVIAGTEASYVMGYTAELEAVTTTNGREGSVECLSKRPL